MIINKQIVVENYNPKWKTIFQDLKKVYENHLEGLILDIQHVGSTSVEGLAAKPIIDIDIVIKNDSSLLDSITHILNDLGYICLGDTGIIGRFAFLQAINTVPDTGIIWNDHNLYVCYEDSIGLKNHIEFRNYLRKNPNEII